MNELKMAQSKSWLETVLTEASSGDSQPNIAEEYCHLIENPNYCNIMKSVLKLTSQNDAKDTEKPEGLEDPERSKLTNREYLEDTILPILMCGLTHICNVRPPDPIYGLAAYIVKNKEVYQEAGKTYYTPRNVVTHVPSEM
ncbi:unnamed protein product [Brassicogethes aeneus]|uniref:Uncharacterized protein n=1 Tax=Brassicogethes aeneus TaxID=1431903 RepID=A0A9P0B2Y1_BRAAE|nr:unnamed protein product [Brassicogethes aeneus]